MYVVFACICVAYLYNGVKTFENILVTAFDFCLLGVIHHSAHWPLHQISVGVFRVEVDFFFLS